jgi:glycosyltransferase involved in cell wall biosynthesis
MDILMVGPKLDAKGGMTEVIKTFISSPYFQKHKLHYLETYSDKGLTHTLALFVRSFPIYLKYLMNSKIKIIHVHTAARGSFIRKSMLIMLARIFKKKTILHVHSGAFLEFYDSSNILQKKYIQLVLKISDRVIVLTEGWSDRFSTKFKIDNIHIINNPVILSKKIKAKTNNDMPVLLYLGRILEIKGIYDLINALKIVSSKYKLIIAGDGEIGKLEKMIACNEIINKNVQLVGWKRGNEKKKLMELADIMIVPSHFEAFGLSIIEAMSYGMPVIAANVGGIPEIITDKQNGILFKAKNVKDLAEKIELLIQNRKLGRMLGENGRKTAKKFDSTEIFKKLEQLYHDLEK